MMATFNNRLSRFLEIWASAAAAAAAKSLQSCPTLCDPIDGSPTGSSVPGSLQARILEWGATAFSNAWKWKAEVKSLSRVQLLATPWTAAHQAPPSMGFSRQEHWSGATAFSGASASTLLRVKDIIKSLFFQVKSSHFLASYLVKNKTSNSSFLLMMSSYSLLTITGQGQNSQEHSTIYGIVIIILKIS